MCNSGDEAGLPLRQLLVTAGQPLLDLLAAPRGVDVHLRDTAIIDPEEAAGTGPGDFVLVIGARGRSAARLIRVAARGGSAAVAIKVDDEHDTSVLRDAAHDLGIAVLAVRPHARWEQVASFVRSAVDNARLAGEADAGEAVGDLFALAQTVATLTHGIVTIEDSANRVLAYSRSDDEVDELRRLSILGRRGPESFLAMLRDWGVYERLRADEDVVRIDERPELGIRRRLAVGIHAGTRPLGTIWVQEGAHPLAEHSERALLGSARIAALHLIRQRTEATAPPRDRENLLTGLLEGRLDADSVAGTIGADPARPAVVVVLTRRDQRELRGRSEIELRHAELSSIVSVHAAAYRRSALVTTIGSRVYVLLPDLPEGSTESTACGLSSEIVSAARTHLGAQVQAAVGSMLPTLDQIAFSRAEAERVLDAMAEETGPAVATINDVRSQVLLNEVLSALRNRDRFRDTRLDILADHGAEHGADWSASLLAYLDAFGDVRAASRALHVHPNTLRHRIRRAREISGIDLGDPAERLTVHLQLLLAHRRG